MQGLDIPIGCKVHIWYWLRRYRQGIMEDDYTDVQGTVVKQTPAVTIVGTEYSSVAIDNHRIEYLEII